MSTIYKLWYVLTNVMFVKIRDTLKFKSINSIFSYFKRNQIIEGRISHVLLTSNMYIRNSILIET